MTLGIAVIQLESRQTPGEVEVIRRAVATGGPAFFPRHRWFGDKSREISGTSLVSVSFTEPTGDASDALALTVIEVEFADGGRERYFVPLAIVPDGTATPQSLARLNIADDQTYLLDDAIGTAMHSIGGCSIRRLVHQGGRGEQRARCLASWTRVRRRPVRLGEITSRVSGAEQSNSAVIFGTDLLAKVFRKLRPGLNPDIEISRFLSNQSEFRDFPELLGDLAFETGDGLSYSIGMMLPFIPNYGDAWAYTLVHLEGYVTWRHGRRLGRAFPPARRAHRRTSPGSGHADR